MKPLCLAFALLGLLALLPSPLKGGEAAAPPAAVEGLRVEGSWTLCPKLTLGLNSELAQVKGRALEGFEAELFHSKGVRTALRESLPDAFLKELDSVKTPPSGLPPGFEAPAEDLALYGRVSFNADYAEVSNFLGSPCAARPVFDIHSSRAIGEYFWDCPGGSLLMLRFNGNCVIEKGLALKGK